MMSDEEEDEHIGPYNGHTKSEALPNGCAIVVIAIFAFIAFMALAGPYLPCTGCK